MARQWAGQSRSEALHRAGPTTMSMEERMEGEDGDKQIRTGRPFHPKNVRAVWVALAVKVWWWWWCTGGGVRGRQMHTKMVLNYTFFGLVNRRPGKKKKISTAENASHAGWCIWAGPAPALPATENSRKLLLQAARRLLHPPQVILWRSRQFRPLTLIPDSDPGVNWQSERKRRQRITPSDGTNRRRHWWIGSRGLIDRTPSFAI
jgi:hypothetical protein